MKTPRIIFVCGTDTDVGKTFVTSALIRSLVRKGVRAGGFKPCESGCRKKRGRLVGGDSVQLKEAGQMPESLDLINPYQFQEALAPGVAAQRAKIKISFSKIKKSLQQLAKNYDLLFVEGAGGLLVPISGRKTNLDLIRFLNLPVLLVARLGLGTINHTLLTLDCLKKNKVPVLGVILNQTSKNSSIRRPYHPKVRIL